jgi:peptidoglycan/LPS O-acetylase OafA/YrhL
MGQQTTRYAYIDAMRGFAALWVVLYHLWNRWYPGLSTQGHPLPGGPPADLPASLTLFAFGYGYTGVTLFFVLSGLCIHLPQARRGERRISIGKFAARRFWRLYPAYLASIMFSVLALATPKLILAAGGRSFDWWSELHPRDALVTAAFLQPVWPESLKFNGVYWTLVYEVQFYAAYPVLLWLLRRTGLMPVGAVLLAVEVYFAHVPPPVECFFPAKYFEWFLGVLAAELIARSPNRVPPVAAGLCAVAGLGCGIYSTFDPVLYPLRDLLLAFGYFGLILRVAGGRGLLASLGSWWALGAVGVFSYSLYLIHIPVIDLVWVGLDRLVAQRVQNPVVVMRASFLAVPISLAAAYGFYWAFERPFLWSESGGEAKGVGSRIQLRPPGMISRADGPGVGKR